MVPGGILELVVVLHVLLGLEVVDLAVVLGIGRVLHIRVTAHRQYVSETTYSFSGNLS